MKSTWPLSSAGSITSRAPSLSLRVTLYPFFSNTVAYISASISFSEKLADVIVSGFLAAVVLLLLDLLELPPDPHAPATMASTSRIAPAAPVRVYRMGRCPLWSFRDRGCPGRISAHLRRRRGARQNGDLTLGVPRQAQTARRDGTLEQAEPELCQHRQDRHQQRAGEHLHRVLLG